MRKASPNQLYVAQMQEIKRRIEVVDYFLLAGGHALYKPTTIESTALQIRQILELIAFASLCAHQSAYAAAHKDFAKHWNAELLLKDIERLNPEFYPVAISEEPSSDPKVKSHLVKLPNGYLSRDDFVEAYKKCGGLMHARNPYGSKTGHHFFEKALPIWRGKIVRLLNSHTIKVLGHPGFWLVQMNAGGTGEVHCYEFVPHDA
jgi:hypothetical protein